MDKLVVHAGIHKTGSSSIQDAFPNGPVDDYYEFAHLRIANGSLALIQAFDTKFGQRPGVRSRNLSGAGIKKIQEGAIRDIGLALANIRRPCGIISAESASSFTPNEVGSFLEYLYNFTSEIEIVAYVREARSFVESSFQQILKQRMIDFRNEKIRISFSKRFREYDRLLGKEHVKIWGYDRKQQPEGDVVKDFCNRMGISLKDYKNTQSNPGLSFEAVKALWCYRSKYKNWHPKDQKILDVLSALSGQKLRISRNFFNQISTIDHADTREMEARTEFVILPSNFDDQPGNVFSIGELSAPAKETVEWMAKLLDLRSSSLDNPDCIADSLRKLHTSDLPSGQGVGALCQ